MHQNCFNIRAILSFFLIFFARKANCDKVTEISVNETMESDDKNSSAEINYYWMSAMGNIQENLMNIQAIVVKDEKVKGSCGKADRKLVKRYLMCAGSILNRNHVLTSASCIHLSTHIRHNVRGTLAVAIAPLNPSMQVIKVLEYKINFAHDSNPYSQNYLKNNIAILKLACRIDMDNLHKIDLPKAPFVNSCEEDNCIIAIYRRMRRTHWVMYQILAPHVPLRNRRRKETMTRDEDRKILEYKKNETTIPGRRRAKRRLAERPVFMTRVESPIQSVKKYETLNNSTKNSTIEQATMMIGEEKNSNMTMISLEDVLHEDWTGPINDKSVRSFVVRSSDGHRGCAQTGAPVMLNTTQLAIASVPCDDRQPWRKWGYTDLYDNLDWIRDTLEDWYGNGSVTPSIQAGMGPGGQTTIANQTPSNATSCSTCIFNFFIQVGCKKNEKCKDKYNTVESSKNHASRQPSKGESWDKKSKECSKGMGIEIGYGRGCRKRNKTDENVPNYRGNWGRLPNSKVINSYKSKNSPRAINEDLTNLEKPLIVESIKTIVIDDERDDDNDYTIKDDSRHYEAPNKMKTAMSVDGKNNARANNDLALQNIEDVSIGYGLNDDKNRLKFNRDVKPQMDFSERSSQKIGSNQ